MCIRDSSSISLLSCAVNTTEAFPLPDELDRDNHPEAPVISHEVLLWIFSTCESPSEESVNVLGDTVNNVSVSSSSLPPQLAITSARMNVSK